MACQALGKVCKRLANIRKVKGDNTCQSLQAVARIILQWKRRAICPQRCDHPPSSLHSCGHLRQINVPYTDIQAVGANKGCRMGQATCLMKAVGVSCRPEPDDIGTASARSSRPPSCQWYKMGERSAQTAFELLENVTAVQPNWATYPSMISGQSIL